jgi:hypothetical protein
VLQCAGKLARIILTYCLACNEYLRVGRKDHKHSENVENHCQQSFFRYYCIIVAGSATISWGIFLLGHLWDSPFPPPRNVTTVRRQCVEVNISVSIEYFLVTGQWCSTFAKFQDVSRCFTDNWGRGGGAYSHIRLLLNGFLLKPVVFTACEPE